MIRQMSGRLMQVQEVNPIAQFATDVIYSGLSVSLIIGTSAAGAAILESQGWSLDSVGLTMHDVVKAAAAGTAVFMGAATGLSFLINCCTGTNHASKALMHTAATSSTIWALPSGASILNLLDSGCATGYTFTSGVVGSSVVGLCAVGAGVCCLLCVNAMGDVNVLKIPEGKKDAHGNNIIEVADLEKAEIVPIQEAFPAVANDPSVLKDIAEEIGIQANKIDAPDMGQKKAYLVQDQGAKKISFDDIRAQGKDLEANNAPKLGQGFRQSA